MCTLGATMITDSVEAAVRAMGVWLLYLVRDLSILTITIGHTSGKLIADRSTQHLSTALAGSSLAAGARTDNLA